MEALSKKTTKLKTLFKKCIERAKQGYYDININSNLPSYDTTDKRDFCNINLTKNDLIYLSSLGYSINDFDIIDEFPFDDEAQEYHRYLADNMFDKNSNIVCLLNISW